MIRTRIHLTESQQQSLRAMVESTGRKQSELIREAIDRFISDAAHSQYHSALRRGAGIWRDRSDLPDFSAMRAEADRLT